MPLACYTMSSAEKSNFLQVLKSLKVPDGYSSNISRGVSMKDRKLINLKIHDGHILMQDILPIALRVSMLSRAQSRVVKVVSDICLFFKRLCAKVLDPNELDKMESEIALTLCEMEKLFPPSFFTIMVHLTIHLISEAKLGGPVHYIWMYPIERYLMRLKSYVRNRAQPEGSIAEAYIKDECLTFCSRYFEGIETRFNRSPRNDEHILEKEMYILNSGGRKLESHFLDQQASNGKPMNPKIKEKLMVEVFPQWLQEQVAILEKIKFDEEVVSLASGPRTIAKQYNGIITNGYRFLTRRREEFKKTQNSGVIVEVEGGNYYGKLSNIIELEYFGGYKVVLFHCDWVDIRSSRGLKKDKYGFPLVNFSRPLIHTGEKLQDDPFIISSQARQVFYIDDLKDAGWSHVIIALPRDIFNMGNKVISDDDESYTQCMPYNLPTLYDVNEAPNWHRKDIEIEDDE
ncbi:zinc finger, CCHC-type containing protein [Tanacetum coccineum]|uniref:Zinc finger, CCHC-type containing protein n=1 Tax=Tanacetum coccineum TaxID=301880 RepID=A0ABQ4Y7G5_9ASTR